MKNTIKLGFCTMCVAGILAACKKKDVEPLPVKMSAKINGTLVEFTEFANTQKISEGNSYYQQFRATSARGIYPIKQIFIVVKSPNEGMNELKPNGEYDKVRVYYTTEQKHYVAKINKGVAKVNLEYKPNTLFLATGTFSSTVFNDSDSLVITDGKIDFN